MNYNHIKTHPMKVQKPKVQDMNLYKNEKVQIQNETFIKIVWDGETRYVNEKNVKNGVWNGLL